MQDTMNRIGPAALLLAVAMIAAGCGGSEDEGAVERTSKVSGATRIERCIEQYPDSTKADCEGWEDEESLADDGTHRDHEE